MCLCLLQNIMIIGVEPALQKAVRIGSANCSAFRIRVSASVLYILTDVIDYRDTHTIGIMYDKLLGQF